MIKTIVDISEGLFFGVLLALFAIVMSPLLPTKNMLIGFAVVTGSMQPAIVKGSAVFIRPVDSQSLKNGDIIAFSLPSNPKVTVLHRITAVDNSSLEPGFTTKGDANRIPDDWTVRGNNVKGKFVFALPGIGYIMDFLKTKTGYTMFILLPAVVLFGLQIAKIRDGIRDIIRSKRSKPDIQGLVTDVLAVFVIGLSLIFFGTHRIYAYFEAKAAITGITIAVGAEKKLYPPLLLHPVNHTVRTEGLVQFDWIAWPGGNGGILRTFSLRIANDRNFRDLFLELENIPLTMHLVDMAHGTYWWQVKACNMIGECSDWTEPWKLVIIPRPCPFTDCPQIVHPKLELKHDFMEHSLKFMLSGIKKYKRVKYEITYESEDLKKGLAGEKVLEGDEFTNTYFLGTCSQEDCIPEKEIDNVEAKAILTDELENETTLTQKIDE